MKVKDLIKLLEQFDGEKELMMEQNGGEYWSDLGLLKVKESSDGVVWLLD